MQASEIRWDERGLVPCIVQDWRTGEVLTLAYMNAEALVRTQQTGETHFFSRSRRSCGTRARPRATPDGAGAALRLRRRRDPGPRRARRAGLPHRQRTCFHNGDPYEPPFGVLPELERTIDDRATHRPQGSYTARCSPSPAAAGEKVQEEAEEVARAAREESDERVAEEAADVLYHLAVLLRGRGLSLADAERVLDGRRGR